MLSSSQVKEMLTVDDIIQLCCYLQGDDTYFFDSQHHPTFSTSLDHEGGDSYKLVYYDESKLFYCFTRGTSYDVFELVRRATGIEEFYDSFKYVCEFFQLRDSNAEENSNDLIDDWDIFNQIDDFEKEKVDIPNAPINENIIDYYYPLAAPTEWIKDGISPEVMYHFGIRIDAALQKIIIPHRDIEGHLIGIRGRTFDPFELLKGKYMPVKIEETWYTHSLGKNLYGLYENKETIKRLKKVLVCESEKAVMQCATMYGIDNNFCVATCGSNLSEDQMNLLIQLGVEELVLGYDKEYTTGRGEAETLAYFNKLVNHVQYLTQFMEVFIIMDYDNLLNYKDSPTDHGSEVLEKLMKNKIRVGTITNQALERRSRNGKR